MKTLILLFLSFSLSGCVGMMRTVQRQLDSLPPGSADEISWDRTGFSSKGKFTIKEVVKTDDGIAVGNLEVQGHYPWQPEIKFTMKNYRRGVIDVNRDGVPDVIEKFKGPID